MQIIHFLFLLSASRITNAMSKIFIPHPGQMVYIQSFKHDGSLHRTWCKGFVLEADKKHIVAVTNRAWVIEADGRRWLTREPAICFFYDDRWWNIISMIRKSGIYYYCNLASPSLFDGEAIKNIDYDLDVKVFPDQSYIILDENEYAMHSKEMNYPKEVMAIIEKEMQELISWIEERREPFDDKCINDYLLKYFSLTIGKESFASNL